MGKMGIAIVGLVCAFGSVACGGSLGDVKTAHDQGHGIRRTYATSGKQAYAAAVAVMHDEHADDPIEEHAAESWAMGKRSPSISPWRYGAFVGVWVREIEPGKAEVEVVTRRTGSSYVIGVTEETMQSEIAARIAAGDAKSAAK